GVWPSASPSFFSPSRPAPRTSSRSGKGKPPIKTVGLPSMTAPSAGGTPGSLPSSALSASAAASAAACAACMEACRAAPDPAAHLAYKDKIRPHRTLSTRVPSPLGADEIDLGDGAVLAHEDDGIQ